MRITCVLLLSVALHVSAKSSSQSITLKGEEMALKQVFDEIYEQTGYVVFGNLSLLKNTTPISVNVVEMPVRKFVEFVLKDQGIDFILDEKTIFLSSLKSGTVSSTLTEEFFNYQIIKGMVKDDDGQPLAGATVTVRGKTATRMTDEHGVFSIEAVAGDVLLISYIGYHNAEVKVTHANELTVVLKKREDVKMNEVVVNGMQNIQREQMTGSAVVLTAKDIKNKGLSSIDKILEGLVVGLNSTSVSGAPGTRSQITIRGENNLSGRTEPLWIVDGLPLMEGVPQNNSGDYTGTIMQDGVGNILPDDIETISILKDASAVAIYGAKAANGVIVITTKKGFRSRSQINYSGTVEMVVAPKVDLDFMNAAEKLRYEESIIDNFGLDKANFAGRGGFLYKNYLEGYLTKEEYETERLRLSNTNTNWFREIFRTGISHSHNLSFRGGSEQLSYYTSISHQEIKGVLSSNSYSNSGIRFNMDYRPNHKITINLSTSANGRKNRTDASSVDPFKYAVFANPYEKPYDESGNYFPDLSYLNNNYSEETASGYLYDQFNILKEMHETAETASGLDASVTLNVLYEILPGLRFQSIGRKDLSYNNSSIEIDAGTYSSYVNEALARAAYPTRTVLDPVYDNGELKEASGKSSAWSLRNQVDYSFRISNEHLFSLLGASELSSRLFNNFGYKSPIYYSDYRITGLPYFDEDAISYKDLRSSLSELFQTSDGQDRTVSFLAALRYSFDNRYVFNFNYRADGADVIGDANQFTPLWSIGGRYNMHHEKFFRSEWLDELAVRGSYGYTGNIDRTAYPFSVIQFGSDYYSGNRYINGFEYPNPSVKWERKRDFNLGIDLALFNSRLWITGNYYFNRTTDILENLIIPISTGRENVRANGGIVENTGIELSMNVRWIDKKDFSFITSANVARNKNFIRKSYYNYDSYNQAVSSKMVQGGKINIEGHETGGIYGREFAGVNPETGNPRFYLTPEGKQMYLIFLDSWESMTPARQATYGQFIKDFNTVPDYIDFIVGDNLTRYFRQSLTYLGRSNPKYVGGFTSYLRYKNVDFGTQWSFKTGHIIPLFNDYLNAPRNIAANRIRDDYSGDIYVSGTNRERKYLGYWHGPGMETTIPKFVLDAHDNWSPKPNSSSYAKGDYIRLTYLNINYRFPPDFVNRWKVFSSLSVGFIANNLVTFTKYPGIDVATMGAFNYPVSKTYSLKVVAAF